MPKFIRSIGKCYVNRIGFDLYQNQDYSATIRPTTPAKDFPKGKWIKFESLEDAESWIDSIDKDEYTGASLVQAIKNVIM